MSTSQPYAKVFSTPPAKFKVGEKVIFTNDYGVKIRGEKTVIGVDSISWGDSGYGYYITPSDSPWCPVKEENLKKSINNHLNQEKPGTIRKIRTGCQMKHEILFTRNDGKTDTAFFTIQQQKDGTFNTKLTIGTISKVLPVSHTKANDAYHFTMRMISCYKEHAII